MPTGLIRRGGRYSMRRRIPADLIEQYGGKLEIVRALNTSDFAEAKLRLPVAWLEADTEFENRRYGVTDFDEADCSAEELAEMEFQRSRYEARLVDPDYQAALQCYRRPTEPVDVMTRTAMILDGLRHERNYHARIGNLKNFKKTLKRSAKWQKGDVLDADNPMPDRLEAKAHRDAIKALLSGDGALAIDLARIGAGSLRPTIVPDSGRADFTLSQVVTRWALEQRPIEKTVRRTKAIVEQFEALHGPLDIRAITKRHVIAFKDKLVEDGQSPANINVVIPMLGTVLGYAVDKLHVIETNPAAKVRVTDKRRAKEKRRAFEPSELAAIFASPVYVSDARPAAGGGEAAYWLPLLSLYTGARQTELGQLHPDDVVEEAFKARDGSDMKAWVVRIVENTSRGQRVKNEGSERRIPVHPKLVELGFIALVNEAKAAKHSRLFPDIEPNAGGELMGNWSKWFGRYRRKECGLEGKDTPFHSFRHTFKHYMRLAGVASEVHNELTGHETGDVADSYGGLSYPLRPLVEAISRYEVPGIEMPQPPPAYRLQ